MDRVPGCKVTPFVFLPFLLSKRSNRLLLPSPATMARSRTRTMTTTCSSRSSSAVLIPSTQGGGSTQRWSTSSTRRTLRASNPSSTVERKVRLKLDSSLFPRSTDPLSFLRLQGSSPCHASHHYLLLRVQYRNPHPPYRLPHLHYRQHSSSSGTLHRVGEHP
jgi:hypothetical protein